MNHRAAKKELLEHFARIGKAVASPSRLQLLDILVQGERSVETLAHQAGLSVTNTSNHLRALKEASLVTTRREGQHIYYQVASPAVERFLRTLQEIAHRQLAEVRELVRDYFEDREGLEALDAESLHQRIQDGDVVVVDVRPEDEYRAGHIPGAVSIPLEELERRLEELPPDREIVAYCRGPYCVMAVEAAELLRTRNRKVARMEAGLPEWRELGFPVATGGPAPGTGRHSREES